VRFGSGLALAILLSVPALSAGAHPQPPVPTLDIGNPSPGDLLTPGSMVIQGMAYDETAETGVGVDRVSLFLGNRDEDNGALFLGDARLGLTSSEMVLKEECSNGISLLCPAGAARGDAQFAFAGWSLKTPALKNTGQNTELYVYARSSVSGVEAVEVIPVTLGKGIEGAGGGGQE
jgi:hypothetical protein